MRSAATGWRGRVAKAALVVGALAVGGVVFRAYPREVELRYDLGAAHRSVTELRLTYVGPEGEMARLSRYSYALEPQSWVFFCRCHEPAAFAAWARQSAGCLNLRSTRRPV